MPLPRIQPIPAQPQPQQIPLPLAFTTSGGLADVVNKTFPVINSLNANVTAATVSSAFTDTIGTLKIATGSITFSTNAVIAAGSNLFTVMFTVPYINIPVVVMGGGPAFVNAFEAVSVNVAGFLAFNVDSVGNAANQGMQWIAIGH